MAIHSEKGVVGEFHRQRSLKWLQSMGSKRVRHNQSESTYSKEIGDRPAQEGNSGRN